MSFASAFRGSIARRSSARNAALASAVLVATAACTMQSQRALIEIDSTNSALWFRSDDVNAYQCRLGLLECSDGTGRLGERRCRCVE